MGFLLNGLVKINKKKNTAKDNDMMFRRFREIMQNIQNKGKNRKEKENAYKGVCVGGL